MYKLQGFGVKTTLNPFCNGREQWMSETIVYMKFFKISYTNKLYNYNKNSNTNKR